MAYSWWAFALAIAGSGIGAFLASYLRRKGEDQATRENFAAIRTQLQTTTRDTEEIKQFLSGEAWRSQRQWSAREQYYGRLLTHLHHFRMALEDLADYYLEPGAEHTPDHKQGEHFRKLMVVSGESYREVQKLLGPAALFLSSEAVESLHELTTKHWDLRNFGAVCTADYVHSAEVLASSAYSNVLHEAKKHLGLVASEA